jgi:outer membrane protease
LLALLAAPVILYGEEAGGPPSGESKKKSIGRFDLENGFERYFLYTKYQIGGMTYARDGAIPYHFPISELKFPLDTFMFYVNLNLNFVDRVTLHFNVRKNIHNKVGTMEDSDWVPYPGLKTVYSESTARLNALFTEADVSVRLFTVSVFSLVLGAGFTHQYLYYWCSDTAQTSIYSGTPPYIGSPSYIKIPCKVITYDLRYYITTIQITPVFTFVQRLEIALAIRFSPYLWARDIDDHILRAKKSEGKSTGMAFMPFLRIRYLFANRIFLAAQLDYLLLNTKGHQTQSYYLPVAEAGGIPGWSARTENKLKSEQLSIGLGAGYSFEL